MTQPKIFYSPSTAGFYREDIHGKTIPVDAVECSDAQRQAVITGAKRASVVDGVFALIDPPEPTLEQTTLRQIAELETQITPRRMREAVLGLDGGWLENKNAEISALRSTL